MNKINPVKRILGKDIYSKNNKKDGLTKTRLSPSDLNDDEQTALLYHFYREGLISKEKLKSTLGNEYDESRL